MLTSKGKQTTWDWHRPNPNENISEEALSQLRLPFVVTPEQVDYIPREMCGDARHYMAGIGGAPYTGYYINYHSALLSVTNTYGYWFEVQYQEGQHVAIRIAHEGLNLLVDPLPGLSFAALIDSGVLVTWPPSCAPSCAPSLTPECIVVYYDDPDDLIPPHGGSSSQQTQGPNYP
jgi:hypothetical protein